MRHEKCPVLLKLQGTATLTNRITSVAAKVVVAVLSGEDFTGVAGLLPGPDALPIQGAAVVRAAGVDGVHVGHQNLITMKSDVCSSLSGCRLMWCGNPIFTQKLMK